MSTVPSTARPYDPTKYWEPSPEGRLSAALSDLNICGVRCVAPAGVLSPRKHKSHDARFKGHEPPKRASALSKASTVGPLSKLHALDDGL